MAWEIILGAIIITALIIIVLLIFFMRKPYKWQKTVKSDGTVFVFEAGKDLKGIELEATVGKEKLKFQRKNIKKGERIEFAYEASTAPATLVVEMEDGGRKTHEI
ncbi:MAG: hypothetical protein V1492_05095 [Candidatus Micrarchaeota archaeon]